MKKQKLASGLWLLENDIQCLFPFLASALGRSWSLRVHLVGRMTEAAAGPNTSTAAGIIKTRITPSSLVITFLTFLLGDLAQNIVGSMGNGIV